MRQNRHCAGQCNVRQDELFESLREGDNEVTIFVSNRASWAHHKHRSFPLALMTLLKPLLLS